MPSKPSTRVTARALLIGERIDVGGLERADMIAASPLAFHSGTAGLVAIYRFGIAVFVGLSPLEEDEVLRQITPRVAGARDHIDDETAAIEVGAGFEDRIPPGGPIQVPDLSPDRFLVIADALAKSVSLARDEREVAAVFGVIEPFAARLARDGRPPGNRRSMLKLIGQALLAQHRVSGSVAIEEKPDVLWDRPDLERLYARLEDEYELKERTGTVKRKLDVVVETGRALTDIIDADRATRLEALVVVLIAAEIVISLFQVFVVGRH